VSLLSAAAIAVLYLVAWPVPIDPRAWQPPADRGLVGPFAPNDRLAGADRIDLGEFEGPEDVAAAADGVLFATTRSGAVLRIDPRDGSVSRFTAVPGRALGIEAGPGGTLFVANAFAGVQSVAADGSVTTLPVDTGTVTANDLAVAGNGTIYFSESSSKFSAVDSGDTYEASLLDLMEHGGHGRVYALSGGHARMLVDGLNYANGVALSSDERYLLIAETGNYRILRHWLAGPDAGTTEVVVDNLPGFPDNINTGLDGRFWVGLVAPRAASLDRLAGRPFLRKVVQRLPAALRPKARPSSHVIAINGDGDVLLSLQDTAARFPSMTGVCETASRVYFTRLFGHELPYLDKASLGL